MITRHTFTSALGSMLPASSKRVAHVAHPTDADTTWLSCTGNGGSRRRSVLVRQWCRYAGSILLAMVFLLVGIVGFAEEAPDFKALVFPPLAEMTLPEPELITFENGLRLYILEDHTLPLLQASVRIHGGGFFEPADKIGLAIVCGQLLRVGGTASWTSDQLDDLLEGIGGIVETSIDTISGNLSLNMLSSHDELAVQIMAEILRRPSFAANRLEQVMVGMRSGVATRNDHPGRIAAREFDKLIYGAASPYARHTEYATLRSITRDDLIAFHRRMFQPQNIQMAVYGDLDRDRIVALIKESFADWPQGTEMLPEFPEVDYQFVPRTAQINFPGSNQASIQLGHLGGRLLDPDHAHRIVMNNILGVGFGSRLFRYVRSQAGLAYNVFGVFTANMSYPGQFFCSITTRTEATLQAIGKIIAEIQRLQQEFPTPEELKLGKDKYLNSFVFNFDTIDKIVSRLIYFDFFKLPRDFMQREKAAVEAVTAADVTAAAKKNLRPEALRVLAVGAIDKFGGSLADLNLGPVETIDITIAP